MLPWKQQKRQILPVNQNISSVYFSLAKFQLVSCNLSLAMIWQMTYTYKRPKLCSATLTTSTALWKFFSPLSALSSLTVSSEASGLSSPLTAKVLSKFWGVLNDFSDTMACNKAPRKQSTKAITTSLQITPCFGARLSSTNYHATLKNMISCHHMHGIFKHFRFCRLYVNLTRIDPPHSEFADSGWRNHFIEAPSIKVLVVFKYCVRDLDKYWWLKQFENVNIFSESE